MKRARATRSCQGKSLTSHHFDFLVSTKARLVSETRVIRRRSWRHLTPQAHEEPVRIEPSMAADVPETQISLQLSEKLHLRFDEDGHRFSYLMIPSFGKVSKKVNNAWTLAGMNWREG